MNHSHEGLQSIFARAAYAAERLTQAPGKALRFLFGLSDRLDTAIESAMRPRSRKDRTATAQAVAVEAAPEVTTQADEEHAELMSGFDRFYQVLGGTDYGKDPLKRACVHLIDQRFKTGEGVHTPWNVYLAALEAELAKQQANKAAGIAPDAEFALALRYAEAKIEIQARKLPARESARAINELDRADRAAWAARRSASPAPVEVLEPA